MSKTTKKELVLELLESGMAVGDIAKKAKTSKQYVYSVRYKAAAPKKQKAKPKKDSDEVAKWKGIVAELESQITALQRKLPKVSAYSQWAADCHYCSNPYTFDHAPRIGEMFVCQSCDEYNIIEDVDA
jgi:hypothetical protein